MKNQLPFLFWIMLLITAISCSEGTSRLMEYDIKTSDDAYVMIQLKQEPKKFETNTINTETKDAVDQIKTVNTKLGYAQFDKKIASFNFDAKEGSSTFLVIRNF